MHAVLVVALCAVTLQIAATQEPPRRGLLYRGPLYVTRDATVVEPEAGLPLQFANSLLTQTFGLITTVRSNTIRTVSVSAVTLRVAFGPTAHGMITYRLRAAVPPVVLPDTLTRIAPDGVPKRLQFSIVPEDPTPGILALTPETKIVFTVERIDGDNGVPLFDNPDATELLWVALGRPGPTGPSHAG